MEGKQLMAPVSATFGRRLRTLAVASILLIPATAQAQTPEAPPPPPPVQPTAPTEPTPPQPAPPPPEQPAPPGTVIGGSATVAPPAPVGEKTDDDSMKFHVGVGFGPSGSIAGGNVAADKNFAGSGFSFQLKVGLRFSPKVRAYLLSLNHFYAKTDQTTGDAGTVINTVWRFVGIQGVGADYFVLPKLGLRAAVGLGGDFNSDLGKDPNALGFSYLLGLTAEIFDGDHRLTIDPYIHMLNYNRANLEPGTGNQWLARPVIGVTANYAFH
jgi:hypothetical protein